jgi:hypothetical protein
VTFGTYGVSLSLSPFPLGGVTQEKNLFHIRRAGYPLNAHSLTEVAALHPVSCMETLLASVRVASVHTYTVSILFIWSCKNLPNLMLDGRYQGHHVKRMKTGF